MFEEESRFRRNAILLATGLLTFFTGTIVLNFFQEDITWAFYPSLGVGIMFGIATCIFLSEAWDPEQMTMKKFPKQNSRGGFSWQWAIPLGVLAGNIIARFLGNDVRNIFMGVIGGWFDVCLIFLIIQTWRHRPK